jgi:tetratricopeptide (TPR) repeat protein
MLSVGDQFSSGFVVSEILGGPGFSGESEVYLIRNVNDGQSFVAKTYQDKHDPWVGLRQLRLEQAALQAFDGHENIVDYCGEEVVRGKPFLILEYVAGATIEEKIRSSEYGLHDVIDWSVQIAEVLSYIHSHDYRYIDLSTKNIIVKDDGTLVVIDIGQLQHKTNHDADLKEAQKYGLMMLRMYNLSLVAELAGAHDPSLHGDDRNEWMGGWQHQAEVAEALYATSGVLSFLYSPQMSKERSRVAPLFKKVISRVLDGVRDRSPIAMTDVHDGLLTAHAELKSGRVCPTWFIEVARGVMNARQAEIAGAELPEVLERMSRHADRRWRQGQNPEAVRMLEAACDLAAVQLGLGSSEHAELRTRLGLLHAKVGDFAMATNVLQAIAQTDRERHGNESLEHAISLGNLGAVFHRAGRLEEAQRHLDESLRIKRAILPDGHYSFGSTFSSLGTLYRDRGLLQEAEEWLNQALENDRRTLGPSHPQTLNSISLLAQLFEMTGRPVAARMLTEAAD